MQATQLAMVFVSLWKATWLDREGEELAAMEEEFRSNPQDLFQSQCPKLITSTAK